MPTLQEEKLKKLKNILTMMDESITRKEFLEAFKNVMNIVLKAETTLAQKNNKALADLNRLFGELEKKVKDSTSSDVSKAVKELRGLIDKALRDQESGMNSLQNKILSLKDGRDADENKIIENVIKRLPKVKELETDNAEKIRDKLEKLKKEERIDISAIRGLKEEIEKIPERRGGMYLFGGGMSKIAMDRHMVDPYTPTGIVNGTNTDFVLTKDPNPSASLKVWRGGALQSLTEDYTISGRTITFLIAPAVGEILKVEHRI